MLLWADRCAGRSQGSCAASCSVIKVCCIRAVGDVCTRVVH